MDGQAESEDVRDIESDVGYAQFQLADQVDDGSNDDCTGYSGSGYDRSCQLCVLYSRQEDAQR